MSLCINQSREQKASYVCRDEKGLPVPHNNGWVEKARGSQSDEQKMSDNPSQQTVGPIIEEISSWSQLSSAQLAGKELIKSNLEYDPGSISKRDFEI